MGFSKFNLSLVCCALLFTVLSQTVRAKQVISLADAITRAQLNDPWLHGSKLQQQAMQAKSIAAASLPDPQVSIGLMNIPLDSWRFDQEAMTQVKLGVSQMLPRGDSLAIKQAQWQIKASQFPLLRIDRLAKVEAKVTQLWLNAYLAQKTIKLINDDKVLFEQMVDIAAASYSTAVGKTRQQDVIRAQLELMQLEDRLTVEQQKLELALAELNEWLHQYDASNNDYAIVFNQQSSDLVVSDELPALTLSSGRLLKNYQVSQAQIAQQISQHPALRAIDVKYQASTKDVELAQQNYQAQWGINASYAYRDDAENGMSRADFFSVGVSFDLPLFTQNKQDKDLEASFAQAEAIKTEKLLLLRQMLGQIDKEIRQLTRLSERQSLYAKQLLNQTHEQAEASLTAYTNDDGDFAEVVRAKIAELTARISALQIDVEALKTVARLNYFFVAATQNTNEDFGE